MIANAYQYQGQGNYSRKSPSDIWQVEKCVKNMRSQDGHMIELSSKKVTLSNKSKFSIKENLVDEKTPKLNLAFFNKCSEIILKHYAETPPMSLTPVPIINEIRTNLGGIASDTFYIYLKKLGLPDVTTKRKIFKQEVIFPLVFEAIKTMNYKCKVKDIVDYLNNQDFEKVTGIKAKASFIVYLLKTNCKREFTICNKGNTDWEVILNDKD